ncbi:msl6121 [Mesorhizobium japonicum MAFF 303099]|uniref:Msl6121 protein n=1 Tax=Mesorhizobium japonicum (strain LMG 29417 / CECT 9101 / MAFF 303099) TaxID=266835 RepID=Q98A74_RHILO|nr:msl6121 [Mesorhizobium japonicum MAFF 303099]
MRQTARVAFLYSAERDRCICATEPGHWRASHRHEARLAMVSLRAICGFAVGGEELLLIRVV